MDRFGASSSAINHHPSPTNHTQIATTRVSTVRYCPERAHPTVESNDCCYQLGYLDVSVGGVLLDR